MTTRNKKRFKKVVKYYFPNGDIFSGGFFSYYLSSFIVMVITWVFFPLFFIFNKDCSVRGHKKVYWVEVKE